MVATTSRTALVCARRPANARDAGFERDLFAESRSDLFLLPADTRDLIVDMQFRLQRRAWRRDHPSLRHEMLLVCDLRAGQLLVAEDAASITVVDLTIRTGLRGLGLGTDLLTELVNAADMSGRSMRARVWSANCGARRFFARHGLVSGVAEAGWHELYRPPARPAA